MICCLIDFKLKEEILRKACNRTQISHGSYEIHIFQDLSIVTLQHHKDPRPLLEVPCTKGIHYRWKFPFCLSASTQSRMVLLRVPEGLQQFCDTLEILLMDVPNWYAEFRLTSIRPTAPRSEPMETQEQRYPRHCSPSAQQFHSTYICPQYGSSPTKAPQS